MILVCIVVKSVIVKVAFQLLLFLYHYLLL